MTKLVIVAGPQASGKTTARNYLQKKHPSWQFIPDSNPKTVTGKKYFGAINATSELETRILESDLKNMRNVDNKSKIIITETGILHCVYAERFLYKKLAEVYFNRYIKTYKKFDVYIIFINTVPEVSWIRKEKDYIKRIKNKGIFDEIEFKKHLDEYKSMIEYLYQHWLEYFNKIPYRKIIVENSYIKKQLFLEKVDKTVQAFVK